MRYLEPMIRDMSRKMPEYATADIETMDWNKFLCLGYFTRVKNRRGELEDVYEEFLNLSEFMEWVFSKEQIRRNIFFHFGGIFDFLFLINEIHADKDNYKIGDIILRGSQLLTMKISKLKKVANPGRKKIFRALDDGFLVIDRTITFKDSAGLFNFGLDELTKNFGVEHKKMEIDHSKVVGLTPELREYMRYDVIGLYESLEKFT